MRKSQNRLSFHGRAGRSIRALAGFGFAGFADFDRFADFDYSDWTRAIRLENGTLGCLLPFDLDYCYVSFSIFSSKWSLSVARCKSDSLPAGPASNLSSNLNLHCDMVARRNHVKGTVLHHYYGISRPFETGLAMRIRGSHRFANRPPHYSN